MKLKLLTILIIGLSFPILAENGSKMIDLNVNSRYALITHITTEQGQTEPETEIRATTGGVLNLNLTETPIFAEISKAIKRRR
ncbi:MAG: hypothetical protein ACE5WD_10120 [Candidatus Aminicenantia bacterium]